MEDCWFGHGEVFELRVESLKLKVNSWQLCNALCKCIKTKKVANATFLFYS